MRTPQPRALPLWVLVSAAWLAPGLIAAGRTYLEIRFGGWTDGTWRHIAFQGGDWMMYGLLTPFVFLLARRFPLGRARLARHLPVHFGGAILLCAGWAAGGIVLRRLLDIDRQDSLVREFVGWFMTSLPFGIAVYFAVLGAAHAVLYLTQTALLSDQLAAARLGALRMQIQPHFLYNSLNAVTVTLRDRDTRTATRMLEMLGEMLHRVMRPDRPQEVPLAEELDFVRQYLAIEQIRFSDRLQPVLEVDPAVTNAAVPDFVLQPLVENALRHGLARRTSAAMLRIQAWREGNDLVLTVTDDGPGPEGGAERREGMGLTNTRERLAALFGARASLTLAPTPQGGAVATIRIPYRELPPAAHG
ncbi:MAG: histidine kinase [Gemmatimonadetes bacterium]|nr:histidine kinase [Gemmatimonadota bacterium]